MKITEVRVETFRYTSDKAKDIQGHAHPTDPHDAHQSLLTIETDEGLCGYSFGEEVGMAQGLARPLLPGETPSTANASGRSSTSGSGTARP